MAVDTGQDLQCVSISACVNATVAARFQAIIARQASESALNELLNVAKQLDRST